MEQATMEHPSVMTLQDWIITVIITAIPIVGFVMLFVWSFSDATNPNKQNWARATLIVFVVLLLVYLLFGALLFGSFMSAAGI